MMSSFFAVLLALPGASVAQEEVDARAVLQANWDAVQELESLQFEFEAVDDGALGNWARRTSHSRGVLVFHRLKKTAERMGTGKVLVDVQQVIEYEGSEEKQRRRRVWASDGGMVTSVDHEQRRFGLGRWPDSSSALNEARGFYLSGFELTGVVGTALQDPEIEVRCSGQEEVEGEPCHVIDFEFAAGRGFGRREITLWISTKDHHKRKRRFIVHHPTGETGRHTMFFRALKIDAERDEAVFRPTCPEGYRLQNLDPTERALLAVGEPAPKFQLRDPYGAVHRLEDYEGQVLVLDFWAPWCSPCVANLPLVQDLSDTFLGEDVTVLAVATWEDRGSDPVAFFEKHGYDHDLLLGGAELAPDFGFSGIPALFVIGPDGKVRFSCEGLDEEKDGTIRELIEELLAELEPPGS